MDNWQLIIENLRKKWRSRKWRNKNFKLRIFVLFVFFCRHGYSSVQVQEFCLSGRDCREVFVRRSVPCGYECYCLSGKSEPVNWKLLLRWIFVFEGIFGLKSRIFIRNYKLSISNYECDHQHFSICDYLREPIYFFSRRSTLIFFSLIHADLFSAPICDFNLRISAWTVFSEFSHPRPNIPQNYSPLKIRGVPPKAGGVMN
jgi:hypothetical protein